MTEQEAKKIAVKLLTDFGIVVDNGGVHCESIRGITARLTQVLLAIDESARHKERASFIRGIEVRMDSSHD